ncbi:MAG: hypothetical protein ROO73_06210 [Roseivirga sp.]
MFKIRHLMQGLGLLSGGVLLAAAIVLAETKQVGRTCQAIDLQVAGGGTAQQLINPQELLQQLTAYGTFPLVGRPLRAIATRSVEKTIQADNFVRESIVYKNWKGTLKIAIRPRRPIARILYPHRASQYIDEEGTLLPLSDHGTARVLLVEAARLGGDNKNLQKYPYGKALLALLNYIDRDPFWRAQIAHLRIDEQGKIVMRTQISDQRIEWGQPERIEKKFAKLLLFYQKIVPYKGWNTYKRVNLEFDHQIVCE